MTVLELEPIASGWQRALDADEDALEAATGELSPAELGRRRHELALERRATAETLAHVAHVAGVHPVPWLSPVPISARMLGLPTTTRACLFDLDGVLTDSAVVHAQAWGDVLDDFLLRLSQALGWQFIPFDRVADYRDYIDGRPRLEGVQVFLASRGIRLPEGHPADDPRADTATALARRKGAALEHALHQRGVIALGGARRYLEAAGRAGLPRAVISASTTTLPMLELAGLATLVEERVDAEAIALDGLRARPAPDLLLAACRRVGVGPAEAVTFTNSAAGIAAGHAAGLTVVGVGDGGQADFLRGFGPERVVPSLSTLLDPRLAAQT
jgi:beta-phosphoglucomutase-like phosphatase (HAD superfamily)